MRSVCCARAASGQNEAEPATTLMKSRRRIAFPEAQDYADYGFITAGISDRGLRVQLHGNNPEPLMSALGQKRTFERLDTMSALPPKADITITMPHPVHAAHRRALSAGQYRLFATPHVRSVNERQDSERPQ
jgi:hypothetical protein